MIKDLLRHWLLGDLEEQFKRIEQQDRAQLEQLRLLRQQVRKLQESVGHDD